MRRSDGFPQPLRPLLHLSKPAHKPLPPCRDLFSLREARQDLPQLFLQLTNAPQLREEGFSEEKPVHANPSIGREQVAVRVPPHAPIRMGQGMALGFNPESRT